MGRVGPGAQAVLGPELQNTQRGVGGYTVTVGNWSSVCHNSDVAPTHRDAIFSKLPEKSFSSVLDPEEQIPSAQCPSHQRHKITVSWFSWGPPSYRVPMYLCPPFLHSISHQSGTLLQPAVSITVTQRS